MLVCLFTASKPMVKDENIAKIWTLSAQDIDDEEIVRKMDYSHAAVNYMIISTLSADMLTNFSSNEMVLLIRFFSGVTVICDLS